MKTALILFAHGSKDPLWHGPIQAIERRLMQMQPNLTVRCAYLELTEPNLPDCVQNLADSGVQQIRVLPLFLGMGRHAREDLPELIATLRALHPDVVLEVLPALGENPSLIDLTCQIALNELN